MSGPRLYAKQLCVVLAILCAASIASADAITFRGSTIPLRGVTVQAIRAGDVFYLDRNNRQARRGLDEISQLGFDEIPQLDQAEKALADSDHDAALRLFLQALMTADSTVQRLWIHMRLSRVHDFRDEYVPAAGHAAAAMMLEPNAYWRILEPTCQPIEPTYPQAVEADDLLREAARQVTDGTLQQTLARMREVVLPIRKRLGDQYNGPPIAHGSTWSGFSRKQIEAGTILRDTSNAIADEKPEPVATPKAEYATDADDAQTDSKQPDAAFDAPSVSRRPDTGPARVVDTEASDKAADEIDDLLEAGEYAAAVNRCEAAARDAGDRDIARLLYQWGKALAGAGKPRDAAVMYTRCAVLFRGTEYGLESLIETAMLYRTEFRQMATSHRLLRRAIELADVQGRETAADKARKLLRDSGSTP